MDILKTKFGRRIIYSCAGVFLLAGSFIVLNNFTSLFSSPGDFAAENDSTRVEIEIIKPQLLYGMVVNDLHIVEDQVKKNQLLVDLFQGNYVPDKILRELNSLPRKTFDFRNLKISNRLCSLRAQRESVFHRLGNSTENILHRSHLLLAIHYLLRK